MSEEKQKSSPLENGNILFSMMMMTVIAMIVAIAGIGIVSVAKSDNAAASSEATTTVNVTLTEFAVSLSPSTVPPGQVILSVHNAGSAEHNLAAASLNKRTPNIPAGGHVTLELGKLTSGIELICEIVGHKDSGMKAQLSVNSDASPPTDSLAPAMSAEQMDKMMEAVAMQFGKVKTKGESGTDMKPVVTADGYKQFDLTAKIVDWEVEPGKIVKGWAYNGQIPGPTLRANVGDKIRIRLTNELTESTSMHLHGIRVPNAMDGVDPYTQDPILQGETFDYEFTALETAVGMYHSHHNAQVQIPNGLAGALIIGDWKAIAEKTAAGRLEGDSDGKIDQEVVMTLNDAGTIGLSLNGKSFPATAPYTAKVGETMLVHYFNEGLMSHPMHLHQPTGWVVARDGKPLEHPFMADTVSIAPGERWSVVYTMLDPGVWAWHCHILTHAETPEGMKYMVTAIIVS